MESLPSEFRVIGINDYLFLDGYRRVQEYRARGRIENIALMLPVVEFRLNHFGGTDGELSRINMHVIFSEELDADVIQSQFLNGLECDTTLLPEGEGIAEWNALLTRQSLAELGRLVKATMPAEFARSAGSDLQVGFNNYNVSLDRLTNLLARPDFRNKHLLAVGRAEWADFKWTNQSAAFKRTLINRPQLVFTAARSPMAFTKARESLKAAKVNSRLLDCSDAHFMSTSSEANRIGNCMTWINALPTFEGLRHAYYEYDQRVYIGDLPPKLQSVREHSTQVIDRIRVSPNPGVNVQPAFDVQLPLNPGFIAIVGNKGRGKSALTDVMGLLGKSRREDSYSFLNEKRFRDPKANLAVQHNATLSWLSGNNVEASLGERSGAASSEAVQYLPQNFLEQVCNEGPGSDAMFSKELGDVIYSHVPEADRLGGSSLEELIQAQTAPIRRRLQILRDDLSATVTQILELEAQLDPQTAAHLRSELVVKEQELAAHDALKPPEVRPPADQSDGHTELEHNIEDVRGRIVELETQLQEVQQEANERTLQVERVAAFTKELDNLEHQFSTFISTIEPTTSYLGIDIRDLVTLTINRSVVSALEEELTAKRDVARASLRPAVDGSLARRVQEARDYLAELESDLDAPRREYQNYLSGLSEWEKRRVEIIGSPGVADTLENYRFKLDQLTQVPDRLEHLSRRRDEHVRSIHAQQMEIAAKLTDIYAPVQAFIDNHPIVRDRFNLSFEVTVVESGLADRLFGMLNRRVDGSYAGTDEGSARLAKLVSTTDFNDPDEVVAFVGRIDSDLHHDNRVGRDGKSVTLGSQLRKGFAAAELYNLVFGLEYLDPEFWLRSDEMPLSQLSPGQRGTLLLLFYLLIDKSSRPILLDQPEENLDNQTVHELLVPAIAEAKRRRQVVVVTHNPNLAVVGDADQVIVADMNPDRFAYLSGAIEDPSINGKIVEILEGTWPAFQNRTHKYTPTSVLEVI